MMDLCIIRTPGKDVSPGPLAQPDHVLDVEAVQHTHQRLAQLLHARVPAPIRGEHCGHVTRSQPITAHLAPSSRSSAPAPCPGNSTCRNTDLSQRT